MEEKTDLLKKLVGNFVDETTVVGFARVRNNTGLIRIIWLVILVGLWGYMIYQCVLVVDHYFHYPTTTTVTVTSMDSVPFPAVSVCNLNPVKKSEAEHLFYDIAEDEGLMRQLYKMDENPNKTVISKDKDSMESKSQTESLIAQVIFNYPNASVEAGHLLQESLVSCTYQGYRCEFMNVTTRAWQHGTYGNCFTFYVRKNSEEEVARSSITGPDGGLSLSLYAQKSQYLPSVATTVGFRIEIHNGKHVPFPEDNGFTVSSGSHASAPMRAFLNIKKPAPYSSCITDETAMEKRMTAYKNLKSTGLRKSYTNKDCAKSCFQKILLEKCDCINPKNMNRDVAVFAFGYNVTACRLNRRKHSQCYFSLVQNETVAEECTNKCEQPCRFSSYRYRVETSSYPSDSFIDAYWADMLDEHEWIKEDFSSDENIQSAFTSMNADPRDSNTQKKMFKIDSPDVAFFNTNETAAWNSSNQNDSPRFRNASKEAPPAMMAQMLVKQFVRDNFLLVDVYFEDLNLEKIEEVAKFEGFDLASSVGGLLGLFVGMSFISLVELMFCCKMACAICCGLTRNTSCLSNTKDPNRIVRTFSKIKKKDSMKSYRSASVDTVDYVSPENVYGGQRLSRADLIPTYQKY